MNIPNRLIVGITGASGIIYGIRLLEALQNTNIETYLVVSKAALRTLQYEYPIPLAELKNLANKYYSNTDIGAAIASGSFSTCGMIVAPCSMKTLAEIAHGFASSLLTRAADVTLKERRPLVLLTRETPLNAAHLNNMLAVTQMGGIIAPPVPAFYNLPQSIEDIVQQTVARALTLFGIEIESLKVWGGEGTE